MINIKKIADALPESVQLSPRDRAVMLGDAGLDYFKVCIFIQENNKLPGPLGPLFYFRLPTMHQTLELFSKAVAFMADETFEPRNYSHHVKKLMQDYESRVPIFASIISRPNTIELLEGLEESYFGVRYGECVLSYDGDAILLFRQIADDLLNDLRNRTKLRFPY